MKLLAEHSDSNLSSDSSSLEKPSEPQHQPFIPPVYDRFGGGAVVDSICNPSVTISLRYIFCHNLFIEEAREHIIVKQLLNRNTIRDIIDSIRSRERIQEDHEIELFTHEGYPINVNTFNEDCKFKYSSMIVK